jgi:threonylcarbamoyladenosine tRNA methylthiotransferase MtaB
MKVSVLTLGCKANQAESHVIEASLRSQGCNIVQLNENPAFCVVNTCSVTSKSDYQSRQLIRRAHNAGSSVIVTGCYSELNKDAVKAMDGVTMVVDNDAKYNIASMVTGAPSCTTLGLTSCSKSRVFLKVQDGCNYACSYCIIPEARGRSRSIPIQEVVRQVDALSDAYSEVVLTGIHLGTYGYDLYPKVKLSDLLTAVFLKTRIRRVRLSSLEVREIDRDLLDLMREERLCKHLHIPLQSGDDRILTAMNRTYDSRGFLNGIGQLLKFVPDVSIGTDIIAGFPGETEAEFSNSMAFVESIPFSYIHVFPFSPRRGTKASEMCGRVDPTTKKRRCSVLRELGSRKKTGYMQSQVGKTLDLLIEEVDSEGAYLGTTGNYLKVRALLDSARARDIVPVRIAALDNEILLGHPIPQL